jgi:ssDNA-specific exonuclease RecJ
MGIDFQSNVNWSKIYKFVKQKKKFDYHRYRPILSHYRI